MTRTGGTTRRCLTAAVLAVALLVLLCALSLLVGSRAVAPAQVWATLLGLPDGREHTLIWELRVPRAVIAVVVGAALGLAGALMQSLTRNPLADPGLLGVNAGAATAVAAAMAFLGVDSVSASVWFALVGAAGASVLVYALGTRGPSGATPVRLALAGTAVSAVLVACTNALVLSSPRAFDTFRFWAVGSLQNRGLDVTADVLPFVAVGVALALLTGRALNTLALGEDTARALGVRVGLVRGTGMLAITLLCGAATAAVGPLGFIGLTVPHVARMVARSDQRWVLGLSALFGPCLLLGADVLGRIAAFPDELEVGIVVAVLGAPVFIALVRSLRVVRL